MKYTWSNIFSNFLASVKGFLLLTKYHRQDQVPPETEPIPNIKARIAANITGQLAIGHDITQLRIPTLFSKIFTMRHRSPIYKTEPPEVLDVAAEIKGDVSGQVAIGKNILQIYLAPIIGCLVQILPRPIVYPRPTPIDKRPRAFPDLVNRHKEVSVATNGLRTRQLVEFYGRHGIGKSALLRYLAHHPSADSFRDGVIDLPSKWESEEELLQFIFDVFYDSKPPYIPPKAEIQVRLHDKQALLLLDNENLAQAEVEALINAVPNSAFLMVSAKRRLVGEGRSLPLSGLPPEDALTLLERNIARPLSQPERSIAQQLCAALESRPLYILGAATMIDAGRSPAELATLPVAALMAQIIAGLREKDRQAIGMLAAVNGASLSAERVAGLTGLADVEPVLEGLLPSGLVQSQASYQVSDIVIQAIAQIQDLNPLRAQALAYFIDWTEGNQQNFDLILESVDAILEIMIWAVEAGRWLDVLRLARAIEGALAFGKRWETWEEVLQWGRQAAEALGDQTSLAWSWHQLGSRALCLNEISSAFFFLYQALRLRETLRDTLGAAVTRHNLYLLLAPPPPEGGGPPPRTWPTPGSFLTGFLILLPLVVAAVVIYMLAQPPTPTATPTIIFVTPTSIAAVVVGPPNPSVAPPLAIPPETEMPPSPTSPPATLATTSSTTEAASPPTLIPPTPIPPTPFPPTPIPPPTPMIVVSPTELDFGTQIVGATSESQSVTVTNVGLGILVVANVQLLEGNSTDFTHDNGCAGANLAQYQSCMIRISFKPTTTGAKESFLSIFHNNVTGVAFVPVRGVAELGPPVLEISKNDGSIIPAPGGTIAYTLTYSNTGNQAATGVVITETVPANTTFLEVTPNNAAALNIASNNSPSGWICPDNTAGSVCTLNVDMLPVNDRHSATFAVRINNPVPADATSISNTAFIGDDRIPNAASANATTILNAYPKLEIVKDDGGIKTAVPGQPITYTLTYSNTGNQDAVGVVITETVPLSTTFNDSTSTPGWVLPVDKATPCNGPGGTQCILVIGAVAGGGGRGSAKFVVTVNK